jgi:hypothetical protein
MIVLDSGLERSSYHLLDQDGYRRSEAHEIEYADLYIDTLAATDFWNVQYAFRFVLREMDRLVHYDTSDRVPEHLHHWYCYQTLWAYNGWREDVSWSWRKLRILTRTDVDIPGQLSAMDVRYYPGWKPKMNQQHQITTALDLIEMAIQDVVSCL